MFKNIKVHALPTEKAETHNGLWYNPVNEDWFIHNGIVSAQRPCISHHIYFTSDEEIKEGVFDKVYFNLHDGQLWKYRPTPCSLPYWGNLKTLREIIATTDPALCWEKGFEGMLSSMIIPKIPLSFLEAFVEKQGIDEVLIEYAAPCDANSKFLTIYSSEAGVNCSYCGRENMDFGDCNSKDSIPKLNSNGEVRWVLKAEKNMTFTRDEFKAEMLKAHTAGGHRVILGSFDEWFDKNYPK